MISGRHCLLQLLMLVGQVPVLSHQGDMLGHQAAFALDTDVRKVCSRYHMALMAARPSVVHSAHHAGCQDLFAQ